MSLDPVFQARLAQHNLLTAKDVMVATPLDLCEILDLSHSDVQKLLLQIALHVAPPFSTALDMWRQHDGKRTHLPTTMKLLDSALRGGIPAGGITELVGPAGVGKSQMCFQLALLAALPESHGGVGACAIYVDTEKKFSSTRVLEMARTRMGHAATEEKLDAMMTRILVTTPSSVEELVRCLQGLEAGVAQHKAALVVVDSIAALMRAEFGAKGQLVERQELLGRQAAALKQLAENFGLPVVVTNQVTTRTQGSAASHQGTTATPQGQARGASYLAAALGTKWAHCVNTRLVLERLADRRFLKVAKSPAAANQVLEYHLTPCGVQQREGGGAIPAAVQQSVVEMAIANEVDYGMQL